jgi:hypothetical protein
VILRHPPSNNSLDASGSSLVSDRQLAHNAFVSRRVDSTAMPKEVFLKAYEHSGSFKKISDQLIVAIVVSVPIVFSMFIS